MHVTEEATHGVAPTLRATLEKAVKGSPVARRVGGGGERKRQSMWDVRWVPVIKHASRPIEYRTRE